LSCHRALSRYTKYFWFWPRIRGDIRIRKLTPRYRLLRRVDALHIVYYAESKLPELFTTGSRQGLFTAKTLRNVYYAESWLPASFTTRSCSSGELLIAGSWSSAYRLLQGVIIHINCFSKSITDLWKFAECKVIFLSKWKFQKSMQLKYYTHRKNFIALSIILYS